jgi:hypothetical protein
LGVGAVCESVDHGGGNGPSSEVAVGVTKSGDEEKDGVTASGEHFGMLHKPVV